MVLLTPEARARENIDQMFKDAGWHVQDMDNMNLMESEGVAVCEFPTTTGPVDYMLFVDGKVKKESISYEREDFWATGTSNKQINFVQHIRSLLKENGRAAVVVPDNVLFEGGAGETVRRKLLETCDLHTILRLPTDIFYAQGVKANVIFFDHKPASEDPWTKDVWIYDLRTNRHFTMKQNPLKYDHLEDFVRCYNPDNRFQREETERFKKYTYEEILKRGKVNLDIRWLKDDSIEDPDNLPSPKELAQEIYQDLQSAMESIKNICEELAVT